MVWPTSGDVVSSSSISSPANLGQGEYRAVALRNSHPTAELVTCNTSTRVIARRASLCPHAVFHAIADTRAPRWQGAVFAPWSIFEPQGRATPKRGPSRSSRPRSLEPDSGKRVLTARVTRSVRARGRPFVSR